GQGDLDGDRGGTTGTAAAHTGPRRNRRHDDLRHRNRAGIGLTGRWLARRSNTHWSRKTDQRDPGVTSISAVAVFTGRPRPRTSRRARWKRTASRPPEIAT